MQAKLELGRPLFYKLTYTNHMILTISRAVSFVTKFSFTMGLVLGKYDTEIICEGKTIKVELQDTAGIEDIQFSEQYVYPGTSFFMLC